MKKKEFKKYKCHVFIGQDGIFHFKMIRLSKFLDVYCHICKNITGGAHYCIQCAKPVHAAICSEEIDGEDEGYGSKVLCFKCRDEGNA